MKNKPYVRTREDIEKTRIASIRAMMIASIAWAGAFCGSIYLEENPKAPRLTTNGKVGAFGPEDVIVNSITGEIKSVCFPLKKPKHLQNEKPQGSDVVGSD